MNRITIAVLILIGACAFGTPRVVAQATSSPSTTTAGGSADTFDDQLMALLRKDVRSLKTRIIAANLTLTDNQATRFWPVYDRYSSEYDKINDARIAIVKEYADEYGTLTDEQADRLIRLWLDTNISAAQLRERYVPIFRKVLPGKIAATFFSARPPGQVDNRFAVHFEDPAGAEPRLISSRLTNDGYLMTAISQSLPAGNSRIRRNCAMYRLS